MEDVQQNLKMGMMHGATGHASGGMGMSIIWMSIISALVTLSSTLIVEFLPVIKSWLGDLFARTMHTSNSITINYTSWYNSKTGEWTANQDEEHNHHLLDAILYKAQQESTSADDLLASLSDTIKESENEFQTMKERHIVYKPQSPIKVTYKDHIINIDADVSTSQQGGGDEDKGGRFERELSITLKSKSSPEIITQFIADAYQDYVNSNYKHKDTGDMLFYYQPTESKDGRNHDDIVFTKFPLVNNKTFKSLFIPERDETLNLVQAFMNKSGRFAKEGIQHKLGFFLHGPPGCGKSSFIKALANYTHRNIVNLDLQTVSSNDQLRDLFFQRRVYIPDRNKWGGRIYNKITLNLSDKIIVMEDMDAASDLVKRRDEENGSYTEKFQKLMESALVEHSLRQQAEVDSDNDDASLDNDALDDDTSDDLDDLPDYSELNLPEETRKRWKEIYTTTKGKVNMFKTASQVGYGKPANMDSDDDSDDDMDSVSDDPMIAMQKSYLKWLETTTTGLNLSGLLNCLDGMLELTGCIVIMTTNHPEKIDPAIIRAGRVTKHIEFTYMRYPEIVQMLQYYYDLDPETFEEQYGAQMREFADGILTPAAIESICQSTLEIDETIRKIGIATNEKIAQTQKVVAKNKKRTKPSKQPATISDIESQKNMMRMMGMITEHVKATDATAADEAK